MKDLIATQHRSVILGGGDRRSRAPRHVRGHGARCGLVLERSEGAAEGDQRAGQASQAPVRRPIGSWSPATSAPGGSSRRKMTSRTASSNRSSRSPRSDRLRGPPAAIVTTGTAIASSAAARSTMSITVNDCRPSPVTGDSRVPRLRRGFVGSRPARQCRTRPGRARPQQDGPRGRRGQTAAAPIRLGVGAGWRGISGATAPGVDSSRKLNQLPTQAISAPASASQMPKRGVDAVRVGPGGAGGSRRANASQPNALASTATRPPSPALRQRAREPDRDRRAARQREQDVDRRRTSASPCTPMSAALDRLGAAGDRRRRTGVNAVPGQEQRDEQQEAAEARDGLGARI